jgi:hypothetical protein
MTMHWTMWRRALGDSRVTRLPPGSPAARIMARTFPYVTALPPASRLLNAPYGLLVSLLASLRRETLLSDAHYSGATRTGFRSSRV